MKEGTSLQQPELDDSLSCFENLSDIPPLQWEPELALRSLVSFPISVEKCLHDFPLIQAEGPFLNILYNQGAIDPFSVLELMAVMIHPQDTSARTDLLAPFAAWMDGEALRKAIQALSQKIENPEVTELLTDRYGGFAFLASKAALFIKWKQTLNTGWAAGKLLWWICRLIYTGRDASINKAIFLELKSRLGNGGQGFGPNNRRRLMDVWKRYKSIAPFWLAHLVDFAAQYVRYNGNLVGRPSCPPVDSEALLFFLAHAEIYRRIGVAHFPHGQTTPTLKPSETWRVALSLPLPNIGINITPLDETELDILESYRAEEQLS